jgi:hypothetical protein
MNALEICHQFAAENYGRTRTRQAGNVRAEEHSRTLYSYAVAIARHTGNPALPVLITSRTYSATTSRHTALARRALHHLRPFEIYDPAAATTSAHANNVRRIYADARHALRTATETRRKPETRAAALASASALHARAETYRAAFKVPPAALDAETRATRDTCRRIDPGQLDKAAALITQATAAADKRRAAAEAKRTAAQRAALAEQEERDKTRRDDWLAGIGTYYPREHYRAPARLRVMGNAVETSHGARVHVRAAARLWEIVEGAHRTGTTYRPDKRHPVGAYTLDEVSPAGVRIGCHAIAFVEMQRIKPEVMAAAAIHQDETADV